ncbi:MAG: hypothetical protein P8178_01620 [Candidatus Thiodiazotropha sp.]
MNGNIDYIRNIPEKFWNFVYESAGNPLKMRMALERLEREDILDMFRAFQEAQVELADRLITSERVKDVSEDTLDELTDSLIIFGKDIYIALYTGSLDLPPHEYWRWLPSVATIFADVFYDRFGVEIYNEADDLE